jgi:4'-phosphopantetheinyl transferase
MITDLTWMDLDVDDATCARFGKLLSAEEQCHVAHFHFAVDRRRYTVRHGRLRQLLAERIGCDAGEVRLTYNAYGKPCLEASDLTFNMSHSRGTALFAFARGREIGCDIEWRDPSLATMQIAARFFAPGEIVALRALPEQQRPEGFYNCWTRKEAYVKARGEGLSLPLDGFEVSLRPGDPAMLLSGGTGWTMQSLRPHPELHAAVVVGAGP